MAIRNITTSAMDEEEVKQKQESVNKPPFDEKNYLNIKLKKGEDHKEIKIRILPIDKDSATPFKTIHTHTIKLKNSEGEDQWKSYVCLEKTDDIDHDHFGNKCPFCEMNKLAYKKKEEADNDVDKERWKAISLANLASETCIIRCIERGAEADGPKFWKFTVRKDGKDPKNMIKALYKTRKQESINDAMEEYGVDSVEKLPSDFTPDNILDIYTGKDLQITIDAVYDKQGKRTKKTSVNIIDCGKSKPLSRDEEQINQWIDDKKVWSDVFATKPYEYLELILNDKTPYYDKTNKKWVDMETVKGNKQQNNDNVDEYDEEIETAKNSAKTLTNQTVVEDDDDIPF